MSPKLQEFFRRPSIGEQMPEGVIYELNDFFYHVIEDDGKITRHPLKFRGWTD